MRGNNDQAVLFFFQMAGVGFRHRPVLIPDRQQLDPAKLVELVEAFGGFAFGQRLDRRPCIPRPSGV